MVDLPASTWVGALLVFLAVALGAVTLALAWEVVRGWYRRKQVTEQLKTLKAGGVGKSDAPSILRGGAEGGDALAAIASRLPQLRDFQITLDQAHIGWSLQTFFILSGGAAVALGFTALVVTGRWSAAVLLAGIGALQPYLYVRIRKKRRIRAFEEQFPEAVDLLGRAVRAGHPLSSGIKMVAEEAQEPVAGEFRQVFEQQRFGLPFDEALLSMADRVDLMDVRIFVTAVLIQREVGGNLAEVLDNISYTIRERFKILGQVRVYTAEGRMSGWVLSALPIILTGVIFLVNPNYMMILFREPVGHLMIMGSIIMQIIGFLWIRKIVNIEV